VSNQNTQPTKIHYRTVLTEAVLILTFVLLSGSVFINCFKEAELDHPDDKEGGGYINAKGTACNSPERIGVKGANIYWTWSDLAEQTYLENVRQVFITRYSSLSIDPTTYEYDTLFVVLTDQIRDTVMECADVDTGFVHYWTDNDLILERNYRYVFRFANDDGIAANDSISVEYAHKFNNIDSTIVLTQWQSDTSISCKWDNLESLHDRIRVHWRYDQGGTIADIVIGSEVDSIVVINTNVRLNEKTRIEIYYGLESEGTVIWQRKPSTDTLTMVFKAVDDLLVVPFQYGINRLTWRYLSKETLPQAFVIEKSGADKIIVPNVEVVKQEIGGREYYTYYDTYINDPGATLPYKVYPQTDYHNGEAIDVDCPGSSQIEGFSYVDTVYDGDKTGGFYISLYEMTVAEFIQIFNENIADTVIYRENVRSMDKIIRIDPASQKLILANQEYSNHPMDYLTWALARRIVSSMSDGSATYRLPTEEEWEWAARAFSTEKKPYPWGWDDPSSNYCNYNNFYSSGTVPVDTLNQGRVDIFWHQQIKGPFHMSGNVKEWVSNTYTLRSLAAYRAKGGSWHDVAKTAIQIGDTSGTYTSQDAVGGIRVIKTIKY